MDKNICNICGASYTYKNGKWVCQACGAYKPEELSGEEDTLYYSASQALRLCQFDEAESLFDDIISKYPRTAKNYWGLILAKYGIKYETDYDGKKIPTCYATSYQSIYEDRNYKLALKYATREEKEYYETQAGIIEANRIEWVEKASKQTPVDIFISYKDTEVENGIERTRDSYEAQEVYHFLKSKGYNVFFSRESLKCYGEKYEPYIFNALNTAKVMIVYGTKEDYVTSTWVKNEWSRFAKKIADKEKARNSLILLYKSFNPSNLPVPLKNIQAIDVSSITWMDALETYISEVISSHPTKKVGLKKSPIKTEIGKKATTIIPTNNVSDRIIGAQVLEGKTYTINEKLKIADKFIDNGVFDLGSEHVNKILESTPLDGDAIFRKFLCINKIKGLNGILEMNLSKVTNIELVEQALRHCSPNYAVQVIDAFYRYFIKTFNGNIKDFEDKLQDLCDIILIYEFDGRKEYVEKLLQIVIEKGNFTLFEILVKVVSIDDVDKFIYWSSKMLSHELSLGNFARAEEIAHFIINVDEGNNTARRALIRVATNSSLEPSLVQYEANIDRLKTYETLKDLLRYQDAEQQKKEIAAIINAIPIESYNLDFYTELLKFYPEDIKIFIDDIFKKGNYYLANENYSAAKYLFELLSSINPKESTFYFYIIMAKCEVKNEDELVFSRDILSFDEYIPMLNHADDQETKFFMDIVKKQRKFREEEIEFKQESDKILKQHEEVQAIVNKMNKCEKKFNRCNKGSSKSAFPKVSLILTVLLALVHSVLEANWPGHGNGQFTALTIVFYLLVAFAALFVIRLIIFVSNKATAKRMFKKYAALRNKEKEIRKNGSSFQNKYEYFDKLVEKYSLQK